MDTNYSPANDDDPPEMVPVDSAALREVGYHPRSHTLFVRFRSGELYAYLHVPAAVAQAFLAASSKGRFFRDRIDPVYAYVRVDAS